MGTFAIAGLQLELEPGDNLERIRSEVLLTRRRFPWVDMILIGELAAHGPGLDHAEPLGGRSERAFQDMAREAGVWLIPGSIYERDGARVTNMTPVVNPAGEIVGRYRKMYPFLPYEQGVANGSEFLVFDVPGVARFGVSICYDMWFPETTRNLVYLGAEIILHPTMTNTIDRDVELAIARANAAMNQCYFFDINVAGRLGYGRSAVFGPGGEALHIAGTTREIIPIEVDLDHVRRVRERGWHGLGQPLKSFRDTELRFPAYADGAAKGAFGRLGALEVPKGQSATAQTQEQNRSASVVQAFDAAGKLKSRTSG